MALGLRAQPSSQAGSTGLPQSLSPALNCFLSFFVLFFVCKRGVVFVENCEMISVNCRQTGEREKAKKERKGQEDKCRSEPRTTQPNKQGSTRCALSGSRRTKEGTTGKDVTSSAHACTALASRQRGSEASWASLQQCPPAKKKKKKKKKKKVARSGKREHCL